MDHDDAPESARRRWPWWHRQTTTTRRVIRTTLALAVTGVLSAVFGVLTASADASLGPHAAHWAVTPQHEVVADLGPLGSIHLDSPLPWPLGVEVTVEEIPTELRAVPTSPVTGLAGDLSAYAQVVAYPEAVVTEATQALVRDAVGRAVLVWSVLLLLIAGGRLASGGLLRREVARAARRPGVAPLAVVVVLGLLAIPTVRAVTDRPAEGRTIGALAGTPMEGLRMTGRMAQLIDTYGGVLVEAYEENEAFYGAVTANLEAAYADNRAPRRPPGIPILSPTPVDPEATDPADDPAADDAAEGEGAAGPAAGEGAAGPDAGDGAAGPAAGEGAVDLGAGDTATDPGAGAGASASGAAATDGPAAAEGAASDAATGGSAGDTVSDEAGREPAGTAAGEVTDGATGEVAAADASATADADGAMATADALAPEEPTEPPARVEPVTFLLVSDLHCNVGMASVIATAAELSGAAAIIDTGDTVMSGTSVESYCVNAFAGAVPDDVPMVVSTGNHDSVTTADQMRDAGYTVLDGSVVEVAGVRMLGDTDPTLTAIGEGTQPERDETLDEMADRLAEDSCAADRVDLLLVHNPRVALPALEQGCVPLALSGHWHRREGPEVYGQGTRYVSSSSGGASGGATIGPLNGSAEMTVMRVDAASGRPLDYRLITIGTDASVELGRWYRFPRPADATAASEDTGGRRSTEDPTGTERR